jgi:hypothetical protein
MCLKSGAAACARPSSAMSPAGYSLAVLSSNRLRFADRLQWWGSLRQRSIGKTSRASYRGPLLPSSKPAKMRAFYSGTDILVANFSLEGQHAPLGCEAKHRFFILEPHKLVEHIPRDLLESRGAPPPTNGIAVSPHLLRDNNMRKRNRATERSLVIHVPCEFEGFAGHLKIYSSTTLKYIQRFKMSV